MSFSVTQQAKFDQWLSTRLVFERKAVGRVIDLLFAFRKMPGCRKSLRRDFMDAMALRTADAGVLLRKDGTGRYWRGVRLIEEPNIMGADKYHDGTVAAWMAGLAPGVDVRPTAVTWQHYSDTAVDYAIVLPFDSWASEIPSPRAKDVSLWLSERGKVGVGLRVNAALAWHDWQRWAEGDTVTRIGWTRQLIDLGMEQYRTAAGRFWRGFKLLPRGAVAWDDSEGDVAAPLTTPEALWVDASMRNGREAIDIAYLVRLFDRQPGCKGSMAGMREAVLAAGFVAQGPRVRGVALLPGVDPDEPIDPLAS